MVLDNLKNLRDYESLNPLFGKAFDYVESIAIVLYAVYGL